MYTIKRLLPYHRSKVQDHFFRLSDDDLRNRFCTTMKPESLIAYVDKIDFTNGILGIFDRDLNIIGIAECVCYKNNSEAEIGLSIEKEHQGKGLANRLMVRITQYANSQNVKSLHMYCLSSNKKTVHLCKKYGLTVKFSGGETEALIKLPDTDPIVSSWQEQMDEAMATFELSQKMQYRFWKNHQKIMNNALNNIFKPTSFKM